MYESVIHYFSPVNDFFGIDQQTVGFLSLFLLTILFSTASLLFISVFY